MARIVDENDADDIKIDSDFMWEGTLSICKIWDISLSSEEVQRVYNGETLQPDHIVFESKG